MQANGHTTWTQAIVSRFERLMRPIGLTELHGLALVFGVPPTVLQDPVAAGVDLDLDGSNMLSGNLAQIWLYGEIALRPEWDGERYRPGVLEEVRVRKPHNPLIDFVDSEPEDDQ